MFKSASGVGRQRGAESGGGGRNRRVKDKIRGERARERRESGDGQEDKERGQEVSKTVVISRQNTSPEKDTYANTHTAPL